MVDFSNNIYKNVMYDKLIFFFRVGRMDFFLNSIGIIVIYQDENKIEFNLFNIKVKIEQKEKKERKIEIF